MDYVDESDVVMFTVKLTLPCNLPERKQISLKNFLNLAPASLLARQLASANNIYLFSVWLWINIHICLLG